MRAASREVTAAAGAVEQARALTARATPLLVETTPQPRDINALATLLDQLPQLADAMGHKVIPLLAHFDQPDPGLTTCSTASRSSVRWPSDYSRYFGGAATEIPDQDVFTESVVIRRFA